MTVRTYDAREVQVNCGGNPASGYADGEFIVVRRDAPLYNKTTGADGEVSRSRNESAGSVTLTLKQTSPFNDILSAFALADKVNNSGVFPFMLKDLNGTTLVFSESAWIESFPDVNLGKEVSDRQWTIALGKTEWFIGGN